MAIIDEKAELTEIKRQIAFEQFRRNTKLPALRLVRFNNGHCLLKHRLARGWTQTQLAEKAEVSVQIVRYWEAQRDREIKGGCASNACQKMADALGMEPLWFDMSATAYRKGTDDILRWLDLDFLISEHRKRSTDSRSFVEE